MAKKVVGVKFDGNVRVIEHTNVYPTSECNFSFGYANEHALPEDLMSDVMNNKTDFHMNILLALHYLLPHTVGFENADAPIDLKDVKLLPRSEYTSSDLSKKLTDLRSEGCKYVIFNDVTTEDDFSDCVNIVVFEDKESVSASVIRLNFTFLYA